MCELFTIGTMAVTVMDVVSVGMAVAGAVASKQQADAQKQALNYNAQINAYNAQRAEKAADDTYLAAAKARQQKQLEVRQRIGAHRANTGGFISSDEYYVEDALVAMDEEVENIQAEYRQKAETLRHQAWSYRAQGGLQSGQASAINPDQQGLMAFGSSVAETGTGMYDRSLKKKTLTALTRRAPGMVPAGAAN
tara:strand:+ start:11837 stop:12418 length:582 start_codon:yes stop_codon:yes gene_type:complete